MNELTFFNRDPALSKKHIFAKVWKCSVCRKKIAYSFCVSFKKPSFDFKDQSLICSMKWTIHNSFSVAEAKSMPEHSAVSKVPISWKFQRTEIGSDFFDFKIDEDSFIMSLYYYIRSFKSSNSQQKSRFCNADEIKKSFFIIKICRASEQMNE